MHFVLRVEPKGGPASRRETPEEEGCVAPKARPARAQRAGRAGCAAALGRWRHGKGLATGAGERGGGPGRRGRLGPG